MTKTLELILEEIAAAESAAELLDVRQEFGGLSPAERGRAQARLNDRLDALRPRRAGVRCATRFARRGRGL